MSVKIPGSVFSVVLGSLGYTALMSRVFMALAILSLPVLAQSPAMQVRPAQTAEVPAFTATVAAQKCKNWTWAAALETVLRLQKVPLDQHQLVTKKQGGEVCDDDFTRFEDLPRLVEGEYALEDGRKVRVSASYLAGAPTNIDDLIVAMRQGRPLILFWKGHAYLLCGLLYDEYIGANGQRVFVVREMKLRDPYVAAGDKQFVTFVRDTDDANDIDGLMQVKVTPVEQQPWQR